MGKPIRYVREREIAPAIDRIEFYAAAARMIRGEVTASAPSHLLNFILKEPVGVCGLITPWNDPVDLPLRTIGAAMATGCTFVLKPASDRRLVDGDLRTARPVAALPGASPTIVGEGGVVGEALRATSASTRSASPGAARSGAADGPGRERSSGCPWGGGKAGHVFPMRTRQGDGRRRGRIFRTPTSRVPPGVAARRRSTAASSRPGHAPPRCGSDRTRGGDAARSDDLAPPARPCSAA
jgi:hypothetical protein